MASMADVDFTDVPDENVIYPKGDYPMMVTASERRTEKNNPGNEFVLITLRFLNGPFQNKDVKRFMYIRHSKEGRVWGGKKELKSLYAACMVAENRPTDEFHGKTVIAKIEIRPDKNDSDKCFNNFTYAKRPAIAAPAPPVPHATGVASEFGASVFGELATSAPAAVPEAPWLQQNA